ncbi:MAG TPA: 2-oxo acid dehydrogenase subunit E2 [Gemmatimonadaceae bacterium]|nr:2-oxo acid dehydrogenase subunit E2 [Gemmatimonadaceae bacterium]
MTATGARLVDVTLPTDQSEGTENVISVWFKAIGDAVKENEPLLEVSTDKVNVEIAAPSSGILAEILKNEGDSVEPGDIVGRISLDAVESPAPTAKPKQQGETSSQADGSSKTPAVGQPAIDDASADLSPAVKRLLKEYDLDPSMIEGTGRGGRITHQDVMNVIATGVEKPSASSAAPTPPKSSGAIPSHKVPHTQMRRSIAQHMVQSMSVAPHVTSVFDADLTAIAAHREVNKADFESRGVRLTYTAYFVEAAVAALKKVPEANSRWHDDGLEIFDDINIGVATALPDGGLIVPVILKAQELDLFGIAQRLGDLTERARAGSLDPRDVQRGTFTISNHGVSGSLLAAPIVINQPQVAILGVGKMERRVVSVEHDGKEQIVTRPMCYVTLTIDHRVLDGFQANAFLTSWVDSITAAR